MSGALGVVGEELGGVVGATVKRLPVLWREELLAEANMLAVLQDVLAHAHGRRGQCLVAHDEVVRVNNENVRASADQRAATPQLTVAVNVVAPVQAEHFLSARQLVELSE